MSILSETKKQALKDLNGAACYSCCLLPKQVTNIIILLDEDFIWDA